MIDDRILIKGNKNGLNAIINIDKFKDFEDMLECLIERLNKGKKFYKGATLTIHTDLKLLNDRQMRKLKDSLFDEILIKDCIFIDKDEPSLKSFTGVYEGRTKFLRKTVRGGQVVDYAGNIVIVGDVNHGGEVRAAGNIIVLGSVKGRVFAGDNGNNKAIIAAFSLQPEVLSIARIITISPDDAERPSYPELAKIKDNAIIVEPYLPNKYGY